MGKHDKKKKKDKKNKTMAAPAFQMSLMFPPYQMQMQAPPAPNPENSSSSSSDSSSGDDERDLKLIKRGATEVRQLPKIRLQDILFGLDPSFDCVLTAEHDETVLADNLHLDPDTPIYQTAKCSVQELRRFGRQMCNERCK